jgi:phenol 2-monooxygenase
METSPDVLIIGSGPAGLMSAIWLASQGVSVEILEKNEVRPERGRADGFEPRTLEILDSFGLLDSWIRKANQTVEFSLWVSAVP